MKITDLWGRLEETFGPGYAASVANDQVFTQLGGRTINQALAAHAEVQAVWRAVVATYPDRVPSRLH